MRLFRKNAVRFCPESLVESARQEGNPGRGWYQIHSFALTEEPDWEELSWSVSREDRLALLLLDIGGCRSRDLAVEELERLRVLLRFFTDRKKMLILRVVYDREGRGMEHEPTSQEQILTHMEQIGPVLADFSEHVLALQGLFVGSWGEMHGSRYLSQRHLVRLAETLWRAVKGTCILAVRTPVQLRMLTPKGKKDGCSIGLFDDALFADPTHMGTFGQEDRQAWEEPWQPDQELYFTDTALLRTPNGGEALSGEESTAEDILCTLRRMHICYLNRVYDEKRLRQWKETPCGQGGCFAGLSLYDYIGLHLGYRFVAVGAGCELRRERLRIWVKIENKGFGNLTKEAKLCLTAENSGGESRSWQFRTDVRRWDSGRTVSPELELARQELPEAAGKEGIRLWLSLSVGGEAVRFANQGAGERLFLGTLTDPGKGR